MLTRCAFFGAAVMVFAIHRAPGDAPVADLPTHLRRPVAIAPSKDGKWLYVANRRSGSISVVDVAKQAVIAEVNIGRQLSDLSIDSHGRHLFALDETANELIRVSVQKSKLEVLDSVQVSGTPVHLTPTADGKQGVVSSLWGRAVTVIDISDKPRVKSRVDLPFNPRGLLLVPGTAKVVVADAFGGKVSVVDIETAKLESVRELPAHNIRGMALNPTGDTLLITHQTLASLAQTTRDDIHWGNLLTNNVRIIPLADILNSNADLIPASRLLALGDVGRGAADPAGVTMVGDRIFTALAGVGEVAVGREGNWKRITVGRKPTRVALGPKGDRVYVTNMFDDSISVIDGKSLEISTISLGRQPPLRDSDRGEMCFHDARLSHDGWLSCHSCHTDGHTNGRLNDNLGDGSFGAPKRVLSLLGVKDTGPWAWNGEITALEPQVEKSIRTTMHGRPLPEKEEQERVRDITAFLKTLEPPSPVVNNHTVERGRVLFEQQGCTTCHAPPTYTTPKTYDVGLRDEAGNTRFNPPSLRGIGHGVRFFHDNRAGSLEEVFGTSRHQLQNDLRKSELADLLAFLRSL